MLRNGMEADLYYKPRKLQTGEFKDAFERAVAAVLGSEVKITVAYPRRTGRLGVREDDIELDAESLRAVLDLNKIDLTLHLRGTNSRQSVYCRTSAGLLRMAAFETEGVECLERLALNLGLEQTDEPKGPFSQALEDLQSRISALENAAKRAERALKCFISFKFDDPATSSPGRPFKTASVGSAYRVGDWGTVRTSQNRR